MKRLTYICIAISMVFQWVLLDSSSLRAQTSSNVNSLPLHISTEAGTVSIQWNMASSTPNRVMASSMLHDLPVIRYSGYELPMRLIPLESSIQSAFVPQVHAIDTIAWTGTLQQAEPLVPTAIGWEDSGAIVDEERSLPTSPLFELRRGRMRGKTIVVMAFSPIYQDVDGTVRLTSRLDATITALGLEGNSSQNKPVLAMASASSTSTEVVAAQMASTEAILTDAPSPTNPAATGTAVKVYVAAAGIQSVSGQMLIDAGIPAGTDSSKLQLAYKGTQVAIEVRDANGTLDASDEIRFYTPLSLHNSTVGDRFNTHETYWLTIGASNGLRVTTRSAMPASASLRTTAFEQGVWENNTLYESTMPGVDADHWFAARLQSDSSTAANPVSTLAIPLNNVLPLDTTSSESSSFTLTGSSDAVASNRLQVDMGTEQATFSWSNSLRYTNWQESLQTPAHPQQLDLTLTSADPESNIRIDKVSWFQPVVLDFANQGAHFVGAEGTWRYQLVNAPADRVQFPLYDVTDPHAPILLTAPSGGTFEFQDGPDAHNYLLAGPTTLHTPQVKAHTPVDFTANNGAHVLYIAPAHLIDELAPLVAHRQAQGYTALVVDVETIYDAWSFGYVSPTAIRDLLRYSVAQWPVKPIAAVLVGDTTIDIHNYTQRRNGDQNHNLVPTYLAYVDPFIGEVPCDRCYAQLDGNNPVWESAFLTDILLGRLSVQDEAQLTTVVNKILRYETAPDQNLFTPWRQTSVYIADNYYRPDGSTDDAGNFALSSDEVIAHWQSPHALTQRVYYDPRPGGSSEIGHISSGIAANTQTINLFKDGPGLWTFQGHSNHFFNGHTVANETPNWLFGTNDIFELDNLDQLTIVLQMTCLSSQFTHVSSSGTTLDERLQRYENGGAIAVWGPAGLTVAHGHEEMLRGFHQALWQAPPFSAKIGELVNAGHFKLATEGACCQDANQSFLLLGDPLTPALVAVSPKIYLPYTMR